MIHVECRPDYSLLKSLKIRSKYIKHAGCKSLVCKNLGKSNNSKGLIDQDLLSEQPPYLESLIKIDNQLDIQILYDSARKNCLIVLCPRLEDWILEATKEADLDIREYHLPNDGNQLHKIINAKLGKFEKLLDDLRKRSKMVKFLERIIKAKYSY